MSDATVSQSSHEADSDTSEISLKDLIRGIWAVRGYLVGGMLLSALIAGALLLAFRVATYENVTEYVIEFRFEGRENNQYPNGTPFSLSDIIAPAVLSDVYEAEKISQFGLSYRDFQSAITIAPFAPERQKLIDKFQAIDARRATTAELNEAQEQLQRDLTAASQRYAVIRFTTTGYSIPASGIAKVLTDIAKSWERNAIDVRGVVKLNLDAVQPSLFDEANFSGLERLTSLRFINNKLNDLKFFVQNILNTPGGAIVVDEKSGYNVSGLLSVINRASLQLLEVPASWATTSDISSQETLGAPVALYSDQLFDPSQAAGLDYLIAIDLIRDRMELIRSNVSSLGAAEFGEVTSDPETGLSIRDIDRLLSDLDEYSIKQLSAPVLSLGIAKNPEVVRLYYNSRLQELRREKDTLKNKASVLEQANQNYQGLTTSSPPPTTGSPNFPGGSSTVIPQFGDAFLDRIIELSQKGGDTQFRQDLLKQTVDLQRQAADIDAEVARISEYINVFGGASREQTQRNSEVFAFFVKRLDQDIPAAFEKLKNYANVTRRIAYRLRYAQDLSAISDGGRTHGEERVKPDFFLRDVRNSPAGQIAQIASELEGYAQIANRLYDAIGQKALGSYQTLFRAASSPQAVPTPLISRFQLMVLALSIVAGLLVGLIFQMFRSLIAK